MLTLVIEVSVEPREENSQRHLYHDKQIAIILMSDYDLRGNFYICGLLSRSIGSLETFKI